VQDELRAGGGGTITSNVNSILAPAFSQELHERVSSVLKTMESVKARAAWAEKQSITWANMFECSEARLCRLTYKSK
jgi:hypothetical protein